MRGFSDGTAMVTPVRSAGIAPSVPASVRVTKRAGKRKIGQGRDEIGSTDVVEAQGCGDNIPLSRCQSLQKRAETAGLNGAGDAQGLTGEPRQLDGKPRGHRNPVRRNAAAESHPR